MQRSKINNDEPLSRPTGGSSDYYRYFKYYFDFFLPPRPDLANLEHHKFIYVKNHEIETLLSNFFDGQQSFCQLLTGHTGIGKSTIVRKFFDLWHSTRLLRDTHIVIPYFSNNLTASTLKASTFFASQIRVITDKLSAALSSPLNYDEFWDYIDAARPETLRRYRKFEFTSKKDDLRILAENDEFSYQALLVKFLLAKPEHSKIKHIIIVFDDVESLDPAIRHDFIAFAYHAFCCLRNRDGNYHVKLLLAERPHTRDEFHHFNWQEQRPDIQIKTPASLREIFLARHEYVIKEKKPEATQRESWSHAFQILCQLIDRIDRHGRDFLLDLCNYNIRTAMVSIETMLSQGGWFQTSDLRQPTFKINEQTIRVRITEDRILKALAYGPRNLYAEGTSEEYGLSNILKNHSDESSDIAAPLVLKWFHTNLDPADLYSPANMRPKETLLGIVKELFPLQTDLPHFVELTFEHFKSHGVVDRVLDSHDPSKWLYVLMPRGLALWESLGASSELVEIYREDFWLNSRDFDFTPTLLLSTTDKLLQCVKLCTKFAEAEISLHRNLITPESKKKYISAFGKASIAHHIFDGIGHSTRREFGETCPSALQDSQSTLYSFVDAMEATLNENQ